MNFLDNSQATIYKKALDEKMSSHSVESENHIWMFKKKKL